ncbi:S49 family peptidase [Brucella sp.]|uniref:S49 family peptidase n=1 Tax=Brucella sp. TaxID=52132 RepID=UPI0028AF3134|nr:S49 family peptidase [Brucella sp.]
MKVLEAALSAPWLIVQQNLEDILGIAAREKEWTPEVLEKYRSRPLERTERAARRGDVAILNIHGALFKRGNLFVDVCGAMSYEILNRDFQAALDDPSIKGIALYMDTPGGVASGCDEFAQSVFDARGKKPITAYVSGAACSAGYWIASAADKIVISESSMVGSIGVVMTIPKTGEKATEIVSSNAPAKRPDVETDEGRARIQQMVDDLETVFISAVARNRGVSEDTVKQKFGSGGVEIGAKAVALGMADKVGQFEQVLADLQKSTPNTSTKISIKGEASMADKAPVATENKTGTEQVPESQAPAAVDQKDRIRAIVTSDLGKQFPATASALAFDTDLGAEAAAAVLAAVAEDKAPAAAQSTPGKESYQQRKQDAGALGFGQPEASQERPNPMRASAAKINAKRNK